MDMRFDENTQSLLEPVTVGELKFKAIKTGDEYPSKPEHTMLASEGIGDTDITKKYINTIRTSAYDPTNPKSKIPGGCSKCKRIVVSFQRLGEYEKVVYVCLCGNIWT